MNRADEACLLSSFVKDQFAPLVYYSNLAIRTQDAVFDIEQSVTFLCAGMHFHDALSVFGMNALQVLSVSPGVSRLESEDAPAFFRPGDFVSIEVERPATNMGNTLCLGQLIIALTQPPVGHRPLDRTGDQGRSRFEKIDLHRIPEPFGSAIIEAERSPIPAIDHDRHRKHRKGISFLKKRACVPSCLLPRDLDDFTAAARTEPLGNLGVSRLGYRYILKQRVSRNSLHPRS